MTDKENGLPEDPAWPELRLPDMLLADGVREVHARIETEWDYLQRSACQMAAGRALWKHVIRDPLAEILAGEVCLRNRLSCLKESDVFEVDFPEVLQAKSTLLKTAIESANGHNHQLMAKSLNRVAGDIRSNDWLEKLQSAGFAPEKNTVWVLEGILYYLTHSQAMQVLETIAHKCTVTHTFLLADFMNKSSTTLSNSTFHFYCDWPDQLLPSLGFSNTKLSQIGDPDANFGLLHDPSNLFNKIRNLPRSLQTHPDDGKPCCRLYLVQASGSPHQPTIP